MKISEVSGPLISNIDIKYVNDAMKYGWYGNKKFYYVEKFEKEFAKFHNRKYALMTPNCTSALHLALLTLGINKNDEVINSDCTWIASAAAVKYVGARNIFVDIDEKNWCIDYRLIEKNITQKTKAIIFTNLYGNMPDIDKILKIAKKYNLKVIEDSAESFGSYYKNKISGSFGDVSVFSFHRTKTLTSGEGGIFLTNNRSIYEECKILRDQGKSEKIQFWTERIGYKYTPSNIQAALVYSQFKQRDKILKKKKEIFEIYQKHLNEIEDIKINQKDKKVINSYWMVNLYFGKSYKLNKIMFMRELKDYNIATRPFFYPLSSMDCFTSIERKNNKINLIAKNISDRSVNLPCASNITSKEIKYVCESIKSILIKYKK